MTVTVGPELETPAPTPKSADAGAVSVVVALVIESLATELIVAVATTGSVQLKAGAVLLQA